MVQRATFRIHPLVFRDHPSVRTKIWAKDLPFRASFVSCDDSGTISLPESHLIGEKPRSPRASRESSTY